MDGLAVYFSLKFSLVMMLTRENGLFGLCEEEAVTCF